MEGWLTGLRARLSRIDAALDPFVFGHIADGNLHVVLNRAGPIDPALSERLDAAVYEGLGALGGSISAEHGVGSRRLDALRRDADGGKLALMQALRALLDPQGRFNPGKTVPAS